MKLKIDHFYIKVNDLQKAINFYENLLETKVKNIEGNRWADFNLNNGDVYFGILNSEVDNEKPNYGDNVTPALSTDNVQEAYKKVSSLKPKTITEIFTITHPAMYKYFQFEDPWENIWEIAEYNL